MNTQQNLAGEIERSIPALHNALHTPECEKNIYKQVGVLAHYVAEKAVDEDLAEVKQTLYLADDLYEKGTSSVRCAIENVLVYSFSAMLMNAGQNRRKLMAIIPIMLFTLYMKQVIQRGC